MRRTPKVLIAVCLTALFASSADAAKRAKDTASPPRLYTLDVKTARLPEPGPRAVPDAVEEFTIRLNPRTVAANPPAFTIDLPGLPLLEAVRTRFVDYRPDWKSWFGTLRYAGTAGEGAGFIHLGYHGEQLTAVIKFEGERFRIVGGFWESHRLVRLSDDLSPRSCGVETQFDPAEPPLLDEETLRRASEGAVTEFATTRLDVLAVYPKVFFGFGGLNEVDMHNFIQDSISLANNIFFNSGIDATYNLVGIVPLIAAAQPPATGIRDALNWLTGQPAEVVSLRNAFGADIVTIFVPFIWDDDNACGVANLPQKNNRYLNAYNQVVLQALGNRAFTANRTGCGLDDFTLAHEIGHNYGMRHDTESNPLDPNHLFPEGRGFKLDGQWATVMGCYCTGCVCNGSCPLGSGAVCNRIPYFSDPTRTYGGVTIGASDRNNAAVGRTQVVPYSGFKAQSANTPPTALFTVSCSGRTCTFNASSSTDNMTIPSTGYWWDFGDGTTGSGKIVSHTYTYGTFFWVHLLVTDSNGQKDVGINTASPN